MLTLHVPFSQGWDSYTVNSYQNCQEITRNSSSNFYLGMLCTPGAKRMAIYSIYAWMRAIDDIADEHGTVDKRLKKLEKFHHATLGLIHHNINPANGMPHGKYWSAFRRTVLDYAIPLSYFEDMYKGQHESIIKSTYKDFNELYQYCYRVASTVALILIKIWGCDKNSETEKLAEHLGLAFQLTNILRDVIKDAQAGKVYLPADYLANKNISAHQLLKMKPALLITALQRLASEAAVFYEKSSYLINHIHKDGWASFIIMSNMYSYLYKKVIHNLLAVINGESVKINNFEKFLIMAKSLAFYEIKTIKY